MSHLPTFPPDFSRICDELSFKFLDVPPLNPRLEGAVVLNRPAKFRAQFSHHLAELLGTTTYVAHLSHQVLGCLVV